jgi:hypothetical protein
MCTIFTSKRLFALLQQTSELAHALPRRPRLDEGGHIRAGLQQDVIAGGNFHFQRVPGFQRSAELCPKLMYKYRFEIFLQH